MPSVTTATGLDAFFTPRRIAVIGASEDPRKFGHKVTKNLLDGGFDGDIVPVSSRSTEILGLPAVPSVADAGRPDLVLLAVPAAAVPDAVSAAIDAGARAGVVYAAGFGEGGEEGRRLQADLVERLDASGLRLIGPNCLGIRSFHGRLNASLVIATAPEPGGVSFLAQSGSFGNFAYNEFRRLGLGLSISASLGNSVDVSPADLIEYCGADDHTEVIAAFMEGVPDPERLLDVVADVSRRKPVIVLRAGGSRLGQRAALSHTSALAGDAAVLSELLREAGATVTTSMQELFDTAGAFGRARGRYPRSKRVAVFTVAGGPGVLAADHCDAEGLDLPDLSADLEPLRPNVAAFAGLGNPVDVTGSTARDQFGPMISAVAALPQVDAIVGIAFGLDIPEFARGLVEVSENTPVVSTFMAAGAEQILAEGGVPNFPTPERSIRVLRHLAAYGERLASARHPAGTALPAGDLATGVLTEAESKRFLAGYGLPVAREAEVRTVDEAISAAEALGYPLALKVSSSTVVHKSDAGGVLLGLVDAAAVRTGHAELAARFPGAAMLVQQMADQGVELIVGARRGAGLVPNVVVGLGGILTEILHDVVILRAPASATAVEAALGRLATQQMLDGYRGLPPVDRTAVAEFVSTISGVFAGNPDIAEIDLNPVIVNGNMLTVVDALIRTE